jgi:hypothetical protein
MTVLLVNKQLGMFVTDEGTPLRTEKCRIPYAEGEYRESTFRMARTQGSTPTYTAHDDSNIKAPDFARNVHVSYIDQDTDYFELYRDFTQSFQANSRTIFQIRPPFVPSAVHNALVILKCEVM